jgi:hypothetical protein
MAMEKRWHVELFIDEHEDRTRAEARLATGESEVIGIGEARRNPTDSNIPEIGAELAVARALSDLSHTLLEAAVQDIEGVTHVPVRLTR